MKQTLFQKLPRRAVMCLDCKSFFASVEAVERGLHPLSAKLCVVSKPDSPGGLVLAASAAMKSAYHLSTGDRVYQFAQLFPDMMIVQPRMKKYIEENLHINRILLRYVAPEDWHPYSIDETFIDVTQSWRLFAQSPMELALEIQEQVWRELGLVMTIGLGDNLLLAKYALDLEAKRAAPHYISNWHYEDVPQKLWPRQNLTDIWGIGKRTSLRLEQLDIHSMYDLAHADLNELSHEFGIIGEQLYWHAHGIDFARISNRFVSREKSYGKSQILAYDYYDRYEIERVVMEMVDQVAARLRHHQLLTGRLHLSLGYSRTVGGHLAHQLPLRPTNDSEILIQSALQLLNQYYSGLPVRRISVSLSSLKSAHFQQLDLFPTAQHLQARPALSYAVDQIRGEFGYHSLVRANSLQTGATAIERSQLVGGHLG